MVIYCSKLQNSSLIIRCSIQRSHKLKSPWNTIQVEMFSLILFFFEFFFIRVLGRRLKEQSGSKFRPGLSEIEVDC